MRERSPGGDEMSSTDDEVNSAGGAIAPPPGTRIPCESVVPDGHSFALCLTHDVDRPYKTYQSIYYAVTERDPSHLRSLLPGENPYWTFDRIVELEDDLGVRSAFYFLDEQELFADRPAAEWLDPRAWSLYAGRYDLDDPEIVELIRGLDAGGWEVGLHGSYQSYDDPDRLRQEKSRLEAILGSEVRGIRQHHLNLEVPETWEHQADVGFGYDTSYGSSKEYGFLEYGLRRPFDDEFVEFPLTLMEIALPDPAERPDRAWDECRRLLSEAAENGAVMTILWHPKFFGDDYPEFRRLYRRMIERALEMGAWVGSPGELYERLDPLDGNDGRTRTGKRSIS